MKKRIPLLLASLALTFVFGLSLLAQETTEITVKVKKDGQVVIVDDFTGRLMPGRRYSDGLHQAIEAKENVKVEASHAAESSNLSGPRKWRSSSLL